MDTPTRDLPVGYYLDNFQVLVDFVVGRYPDLLGARERDFIDRFALATESARRLVVRLLSRRGPLFREDLLAYDELPHIPTVIDEAIRAGLIHVENDLPLDTICQTIETNLFELLARRVKSLAESANDRSVLSARADEAYATLATDGSSTSISGGGAVVAIGALTKAVITVLEGVALRESEVRGLLLRAEREADAECLARMSDTSGADSKVEMGGGAADLLSVCQMVAREKAA